MRFGLLLHGPVSMRVADISSTALNVDDQRRPTSIVALQVRTRREGVCFHDNLSSCFAEASTRLNFEASSRYRRITAAKGVRQGDWLMIQVP